MSQCEKILEALKRGDTVSPFLAYDKFGCLALHSRIAELRSKGHTIDCRIVSDGAHRWGEYKLIEQSEFVL